MDVAFALFVAGMMTTTYLVSRLNRRLVLAQQELEVHRQDLEATVSERTRELEEANNQLVESERALRSLYDITSNPNVGFSQRVEKVLGLGCERFGAESGLFLSKDALGITARCSSPPRASQDLVEKASGFLSDFCDAQVVGDINYFRSSDNSFIPGQEEACVDSTTCAVILLELGNDLSSYLCFEFDDDNFKKLSDVDEDIAKLMAQWIVHELEQSRVTEDLNDKRSQLSRVSRLNTFGEAAATVVHELGQPLTAITNYVSGLKKVISNGQSNSEELKSALHKLDSQTIRAAKIMQRFDSIINPGERSVTEVDVTECIKSALKMMQDVLERNHVRVIFVYDSPAFVHADQTQIEQVMLNLIQNALDVMKSQKSSDRFIRIENTGCDDDGFKIEVTNSGTPLKTDIAKEVFNPYFSTKDNGMGLGLPICRTIMESLGGNIEVGSLNPHTQFRLTFPVIARAGL